MSVALQISLKIEMLISFMRRSYNLGGDGFVHDGLQGDNILFGSAPRRALIKIT